MFACSFVSFLAIISSLNVSNVYAYFVMIKKIRPGGFVAERFLEQFGKVVLLHGTK